MKKIMKYILVCGIALPFIADSAAADEITLKRSVIGSGGMVAASNESGETLSGVMGQTAIGKRESEFPVEGKLWDLYQGFWSPGDTRDGVDDGDVVITNTGLKNYPNPVSSSTTIEYEMPGYGDVSINIYDMNGKRIKTFAVGNTSGVVTQTWDVTDDSGADVASGSYLCEVVVVPVGASSFEAQSVRTVMVVAK